MFEYPEFVKVNDKKYKINTDFRIAIECNEIAMNESIGDYERALAVIYKLFGDNGLNDTDNHEQLLKLALKYLACGKEIEKNSNEEPDMDFVQDMDYIKASFRSDYNINLDNEEMHWWEFCNLMNGLSNSEFGNCCVLNRIRNIRNIDEKQIKGPKELEKIREAKKQVALKKRKKVQKLTEEQMRNIENYYKITGINRKE